MRTRATAMLTALLASLLLGTPVFAQVDDAVALRERLKEIYAARPDLQAAFREADWKAIPGSRAGALADLEEWARKYGYKEHPEELVGFAPAVALRRPPPALEPREAAFVPVKQAKAEFDFGGITADAALVVDMATRKVLLSRNAQAPHPLASVTKLMTAMVALERGIAMEKVSSITEDDEVGGARLRVDSRDRLPVKDLFYAMLVGSANNAANAIARSCGLAKDDFVEAMNGKAKVLGLKDTKFTDPSGIDVGNVSTAQDMAALGIEAFAVPWVRRATTTAAYDVRLASRVHKVKNTNELLIDEDNGLYVLGGKTGYLDEAKWNLVVKMRDSRNKPLLVVVLGADSKARSFDEAAKLARWTWNSYRWLPAK